MNRNTAVESVTPLLVAGAVERTGDAEIPGAYCAERDVWVVEGPEGPRPIARTERSLGTTKTLTRVRNEQDDSDAEGALASTTTFTKVQAEADDTDVAQAGALEIVTKTHAQVEHEDTEFTVDLLSSAETEGGPGVLRIQ